MIRLGEFSGYLTPLMRAARRQNCNSLVLTHFFYIWTICKRFWHHLVSCLIICRKQLHTDHKQLKICVFHSFPSCRWNFLPSFLLNRLRMEAYYKLHEIMIVNICEISFDSRSETRMWPARCWQLAYMTLSSYLLLKLLTISRFRRSAIRLVS